MFDERILKHILKCTISEAHRRGNQDWTLSLEELDAFIALIYARGALGSSGLELDELWSEVWGPPIFRETMARNRFRKIMKYLRFDEKSSRRERLENDKFAHVSFVWDTFTENCKTAYKPSEFVTVDEQLLPSKARCRFTQNIASKPDKFGIKFWICADVKSKYVLQGFPYLGKDETHPADMQLGEHVVLKLMEPFLDKGRNVTTDNFFTSLSLARRLLSRSTSLVGTVRMNKRELPPVAKDVSSPRFESTILKTETEILTIYRCKPRKNVAILSTMHSDVRIADNEKKVPESVDFYNHTKYGVDIVDQMARKYTTRSGSRRWPVATR